MGDYNKQAAAPVTARSHAEVSVSSRAGPARAGRHPIAPVAAWNRGGEAGPRANQLRRVGRKP